MKRLLPIVVVILLIAYSCRKDDFPDEFSIYGKWKELTTDTLRTEIEFRFYNDMLLKLRTDSLARAFKYKLDKPNELEVFEISEFPDGISDKHKITYNSKDEEITIYGLYPTTGDPSSTVFIRK
ncbi:MAG TPA: hypothetical protein VK212_05770 [Lentimicrobium sp.]|nr:hypothetical protein [Lentimicrobium sp.]